MSRTLSAIGAFGALLFVCAQAEAHVCNIVLSRPAVTTTCGDPDEPDEVASFTPTVLADGSIRFSDDAFTGYGWRAGTQATLGDSHALDDGKFYVFALPCRSTVTVTFANDPSNPAPFDPAFSLYAGSLPELGHDDASFDPLNPVDDVSFLPIASPTDTAPRRGYHYRPLDAWRDTKLYTQTGGLGPDGYPKNPFIGQFNAYDDFSLANAEAVPGSAPGENWSSVDYITHQNRNGKGRAESLTVSLPAGTYTIAAGGANCLDLTTGSACLTGPSYAGVLTLKIH